MESTAGYSRPVATATTNDVLAMFKILEKRIAGLENHLERRFEVDPEILEEGEFLKQQLAGVGGQKATGLRLTSRGRARRRSTSSAT
jgi:hypothetical protein